MKWLVWSALTLTLMVLAIWITGALLPKSHSVSRSIQLRQPPEVVWQAVTGPPNWRPEIKSYQELPPVGGHKVWRETDSRANAITYEETEASIVSGSTPMWRRVTRIADRNLPFGGTWLVEIVPADGGSKVTITENGEVYNPFFRFASRFIFGHTATIDAYLKNLSTKFS